MTPLELKDYLTDKLTQGLMNLSQSYSHNPNLLNDLDSLTAPQTEEQVSKGKIIYNSLIRRSMNGIRLR